MYNTVMDSSNSRPTQRAKSGDSMRHSVGATMVVAVMQQLLGRAEALGLDRAVLLRRVGLRECEIEDPEARVPLESIYALLEAVVESSNDRLMHLNLVRGLDIEAFGALAFLVITSPTLRAGLDAMLRYQRLWNDGERFELTECDGWARIVYTPWGPPRIGHHWMAEAVALDITINAASMTGAPFDRARILLRCAAPSERELHRKLFRGIEAEFDAARDEVWLRSSDLDRPVQTTSREAVQDFFVHYLDDKLRALPPSGLVGRVREHLSRDVVRYDNLSALAKSLHMSARTLQRQLAEDGTSVRALAADVRRTLAIERLEAGVSIAEIACALGFSSPTALHRAFRRWTGMTPLEYRERAR